MRKYKDLIPPGMENLRKYLAKDGTPTGMECSTLMFALTHADAWAAVQEKGRTRYLNAKSGYVLDHVRVDPNRLTKDDEAQKPKELPRILPDLHIRIGRPFTYTYRDYIAACRDAVAQYNSSIDETSNYLRILLVEDASWDFYVTNTNKYHDVFRDENIIHALSYARANIVIWTAFERKEGQDAGRVIIATPAGLGFLPKTSYLGKRLVAGMLHHVPEEDIKAYAGAAQAAYVPLEKVPQTLEELSPAAQGCINFYVKSALSGEEVQRGKEIEKKLAACQDPQEKARLLWQLDKQAKAQKQYHQEMLRLYTSHAYLLGACEVRQAAKSGTSIETMAITSLLKTLEREEEEPDAVVD